MATKHLHVLGIDPGGTTGWCLITVPRASIFGEENPRILEWDYGEFAGRLAEQASNIARLSREIQSLDYKIGPALVVEDWTIEATPRSTDPETLSPVRLTAMIVLLQYQKLLGDSTITLQNRALAKSTVTDDRLKRKGFWVKGSDHIRDATKHALTALQRARQNPDFGEQLWPN